jgi:cytochrome P450
LLDLLIHARHDDGQAMRMDEVRDEAMTFVLAGHETTSNLLSWFFFEMGQHPEIVADLKAEVKSTHWL